ncbi:hypothetical protein BLA29_015296, partial [Euroglyphus maynei]
GTEVLVVDENNPVSNWRVGRVVDKIAGTDGVIRTYTINVDGRTLNRPAQKIAPLEFAPE